MFHLLEGHTKHVVAVPGEVQGLCAVGNVRDDDFPYGPARRRPRPAMRRREEKAKARTASACPSIDGQLPRQLLRRPPPAKGLRRASPPRARTLLEQAKEVTGAAAAWAGEVDAGSAGVDVGKAPAANFAPSSIDCRIKSPLHHSTCRQTRPGGMCGSTRCSTTPMRRPPCALPGIIAAPVAASRIAASADSRFSFPFTLPACW